MSLWAPPNDVILKTESPSKVFISGVSTQKWPSNQITMVWKDTSERMVRRCDDTVDKKRVNSCVLKHLFLERVEQPKISPKNPGISLSDALLMSCFQNFAANAAKKTTAVLINQLINQLIRINSGPNILRSCFLHWYTCIYIDWCCFYYFVRNRLVALLEAVCARIFFQIREIDFADILFSSFFFFLVCKALVSNKRPSSVPHKQAPVPGCCHSSCVLIIHDCFFVCAFACAYENV